MSQNIYDEELFVAQLARHGFIYSIFHTYWYPELMAEWTVQESKLFVHSQASKVQQLTFGYE